MKCVIKSDIERSNLHLGEFQRVVLSPVKPPHAVSTRRAASCVVVAVQVGVATMVVPPGSLVILRTPSVRVVVVLVFSAELVSKMPF